MNAGAASTSTDERGIKRHSLKCTVLVYKEDKSQLIGTVNNLSAKGAKVIGRHLLTEQQRLTIVLEARQSDSEVLSLSLLALCVRCQELPDRGAYDIGLQFQELTPTITFTIAKIIKLI